MCAIFHSNSFLKGSYIMLPLLKNPCTTFSVADLKQIDCWELLQQKDVFIQDQQRNATGSIQPMEVPERGQLLQKGKVSW